MECSDGELRYINLKSDGWSDATKKAHEIAQDEKPPSARDADHLGEHVHYAHNPAFKTGVPPGHGKFQELAEFVVPSINYA